MSGGWWRSSWLALALDTLSGAFRIDHAAGAEADEIQEFTNLTCLGGACDPY
jgi:hypothetical protein